IFQGFSHPAVNNDGRNSQVLRAENIDVEFDNGSFPGKTAPLYQYKIKERFHLLVLADDSLKDLVVLVLILQTDKFIARISVRLFVVNIQVKPGSDGFDVIVPSIRALLVYHRPEIPYAETFFG